MLLFLATFLTKHSGFPSSPTSSYAFQLISLINRHTHGDRDTFPLPECLALAPKHLARTNPILATVLRVSKHVCLATLPVLYADPFDGSTRSISFTSICQLLDLPKEPHPLPETSGQATEERLANQNIINIQHRRICLTPAMTPFVLDKIRMRPTINKGKSRPAPYLVVWPFLKNDLQLLLRQQSVPSVYGCFP